MLQIIKRWKYDVYMRYKICRNGYGIGRMNASVMALFAFRQDAPTFYQPNPERKRREEAPRRGSKGAML